LACLWRFVLACVGLLRRPTGDRSTFVLFVSFVAKSWPATVP